MASASVRGISSILIFPSGVKPRTCIIREGLGGLYERARGSGLLLPLLLSLLRRRVGYTQDIQSTCALAQEL
jgi:hypothetical protein